VTRARGRLWEPVGPGLDHGGDLALLPPSLTDSEKRSDVRSRIEAEWTGWDGSTVVTLVDGSVWQQDEYYYRYQYKYRPEVIVDGNRMHVDGMPKAIRVRRLR
jgi:hypothetical protein